MNCERSRWWRYAANVSRGGRGALVIITSGAMNRRTFLTTGGMALGLAASGCAARRATMTPARAPLRLLPVHASWDRIIRTTVGLRPHRDAGFVLRAESLDDKTLIHNYGHGGSGMSISWGTGAMAADLALATGTPRRSCRRRRRGPDGCAATAATRLRRHDLRDGGPPERHLEHVAGRLHADLRSRRGRASHAGMGCAVHARGGDRLPSASIAGGRCLRHHLGFAVPARPGSPAAPGRESGATEPESGLQTERVILQPGEHPFPTEYAIQRTSMRIEPSIYLETLMRDVLNFGGRIVIKKFDSPRDLMALPEQVVVNCSGLGALDLFGDKELMPVKGQLTVLVPQAEVNYQTSGGLSVPSTPGIGIHMMPRSDGIVLGGTAQRGVWTMEPDEAERQRVVEGHIELSANEGVNRDTATDRPVSAACVRTRPRSTPSSTIDCAWRASRVHARPSSRRRWATRPKR